MTLPNNTAAVVSGFEAFTKAEIAHEKATTRLVAKLSEEGVELVDIQRGGRFLSAFMEGVARGVLTEKQFATWSDTSLSTKADKVLTERGKLQASVSSRAAKIRAAYGRALSAMTESNKRGASAGGNKRTFDEVMLAKVDEWVERINRDKDKDSFNMTADPLEVRAALLNVAKLLKA